MAATCPVKPSDRTQCLYKKMLICYGPLWNNWNRKVEARWEVGTKTRLATQLISLKLIFSKSMMNTSKAIPTWLSKSKLGFLLLPRPQGPLGHLEVSPQKLYDQTANTKAFPSDRVMPPPQYTPGLLLNPNASSETVLVYAITDRNTHQISLWSSHPRLSPIKQDIDSSFKQGTLLTIQ